MKKLILIIILFIPLSVQADIFLKYGAAIFDDESKTFTWVGLWGEADNCNHCISLFALETYDNDGVSRDKILGIDFVIKSFKSKSSVIRTNLGFAVADEVLQRGEKFNFHFGISIENKKCIQNKYSCLISYDHFSNGKTLFDRNHIPINIPLDLVSIGIGF